MKGDLADMIRSKLVEYRSAGKTIAEAAQHLGVAYQTAQKWAKELEVEFPHGSRNSGRAERNNEIRRRYLAGEAQADIAREYGLTRERIRQICDAGGCVSETKRHADYVATVVGTIKRKNLTALQAAKMFNASLDNIYLYCKAHDIRPARMTTEEAAAFEAAVQAAADGQSIRKVVGFKGNLARKVSEELKNRGISGGGRSRWDDMSERAKLVGEWRSSGYSWGQIASLLAVHDNKPIGQHAVYGWAKRHLPHLFEQKQSADREASEVAA